MFSKKFFGYILVLVTMVSLNSVNAATMFFANLDGSQIHPLDGGPSNSSATGSATFILGQDSNGDPTLNYSIQLVGLDLVEDPADRTDLNDVTAIHIHIGAADGKGPHALNIFGVAGGSIREDDSDLNVDFVNEMLTGTWDNSDEVFTGLNGAKQPFDSFGLSAMLNNLQSGGLYLQLHTNERPSGEIRGQVVVPEPSTLVLVTLGLGLIGFKLKRSKQ